MCKDFQEVKEKDRQKMSSSKKNETVKENRVEIQQNEAKNYDFLCGIGQCKPRWIQQYATSQSFLVIFSILGVVQGSYFTYLLSVMSTLEKRYAFKSKVTGSIIMMDDLLPIFIGIPIGYFGGKSHRPRIIGISLLLTSLSCFINTLPYFLYGTADRFQIFTYSNQTNINAFCNYDDRTLCDDDERPPTLSAVIVLIISGIIKGFGNTAYYTIGFTFMDDITRKKNSPIYFTLAGAFRLVGPTLGYFIASWCLKFYENPLVDPGYGPDDPRWIGAWWMGFCLQGILIAIPSFLIFIFPKQLPNQKTSIHKISNKNEDLKSHFSGFFEALKRLVKNKLYLAIQFHSLAGIYSLYGHFIMLTKYMENQFRLSASDASLYSGPPALVAVIIGSVTGGFLMWRYKPRAKLLIGCMIAAQMISLIFYFILMIPQCSPLQLAHFGSNEEGLILENECNANCSCTTDSFTPLCDPDELTTYFSPCYAGCKAIDPNNGTKVYKDCSCAINANGSFAAVKVMEAGFCIDKNCWSQALAYIIIMPILYGIINMYRIPDTIILLRAVKPEDKSVTTGAHEAVISLLGLIPTPVIFGAVIDSVCLVWEKSCGQFGNCWLYDTKNLNYFYHGISALFIGIDCVCLIVVYFLINQARDLYEEDEIELERKVDTKNAKF